MIINSNDCCALLRLLYVLHGHRRQLRVLY